MSGDTLLLTPSQEVKVIKPYKIMNFNFFPVLSRYKIVKLHLPECHGALLVQPLRCSGFTVCCVSATGRISAESAGKRAQWHIGPCRQLDPDQQEHHKCKDGLENYVPRLSSSTCSREFSMHCWRVSSEPWRRLRPNCPSEPTTWRESAKPDSGRGESSGNLDKRTKLPPVTGWGMAAVKVNY